MTTNRHIADVIERQAPLSWQESYDNAGWQVGDSSAPVKRVLLCTDVTEAVVAEAIERQATLVVSHHPLIFRPLKRLTGSNHIERIVATAIRHDIAIYSAHTNLDNAPTGVSAHMAERLGVSGFVTLDPQDETSTHGCGVVGDIEPTTARELVQRVKRTFDAPVARCNAFPLDTVVTRVAMCGGAGSFLTRRAVEAGAQAFITGDVKYHEFMGLDDEILIIDIGHYESEHYTREMLRKLIAEHLPDVELIDANAEANAIRYL